MCVWGGGVGEGGAGRFVRDEEVERCDKTRVFLLAQN